MSHYAQDLGIALIAFSHTTGVSQTFHKTDAHLIEINPQKSAVPRLELV